MRTPSIFSRLAPIWVVQLCFLLVLCGCGGASLIAAPLTDASNGGAPGDSLRVDIDVNTDRDIRVHEGRVEEKVEDDEDELGEDCWSPTRGAIFIVNYDDDQPDGHPRQDAIAFDEQGKPISVTEDLTVNGPGDVADLAKIVLRKVGNKSDFDFYLQMNAHDAKAIHLFAGRRPGEQVRFGGWSCNRFRRPQETLFEQINDVVQEADDVTLGVEGLFLKGQRP